ncbi:nicotinamidase-related amidase [Actinoplanes lutulentus]|uniref:Nicotinamidase-related amidase n=1 Tax=Actinoplanes lutulentus TaxID=1287878 RepID=A0A327Z2I2_9ACTN|nr:isochorismatase family protein [Actinoplanes lutulentus]MBB2946504.1 nicotinamidase-related amidase [Actinoplanes lutulentus]RAK26422.1 nicotinamidase-related amidase [Actinoplanes lutulentus]
MSTTTSSWWPAAIAAADETLYARAGFGRTSGLGVRPALLVIDVQYRTVGHERVPITEAMNEFPTATGDRGWDAVDRIAQVLTAAREAAIPIFHPHVAPKTKLTAGGYAAKTPTLASTGAGAYDFVTGAAPRDDEPLIAKDHPSAFFATGLLTHLVQRGVDTVLLTGATTSGCVRASAVDAFSYGFRVGIVGDAVFDRLDVVHEVALFDLAAKYADVMTADAAGGYLRGLGRESA